MQLVSDGRGGLRLGGRGSCSRIRVVVFYFDHVGGRTGWHTDFLFLPRAIEVVFVKRGSPGWVND